MCIRLTVCGPTCSSNRHTGPSLGVKGHKSSPQHIYMYMYILATPEKIICAHDCIKHCKYVYKWSVRKNSTLNMKLEITFVAHHTVKRRGSRLASVPGLPLTRFNCAGVGKSSFDLPTPAQLKHARKGKAWNRG